MENVENNEGIPVDILDDEYIFSIEPREIVEIIDTREINAFSVDWSNLDEALAKGNWD